jgi:hypothetical protein
MSPASARARARRYREPQDNNEKNKSLSTQALCKAREGSRP